MKVHRLYLGLKTSDGLRELTPAEREAAVVTVGAMFQGFTLFEASGYWEGKREPAYVFEVLDESTRKVFELAAVLREMLHQTAVLVTIERDLSAHLIEAPSEGLLPRERYSARELAPSVENVA